MLQELRMPQQHLLPWQVPWQHESTLLRTVLCRHTVRVRFLCLDILCAQAADQRLLSEEFRLPIRQVLQESLRGSEHLHGNGNRHSDFD